MRYGGRQLCGHKICFACDAHTGVASKLCERGGRRVCRYVIGGALKAASGAGFEDALVSSDGSKDTFVADITPFQMGSDHDVYQEGSFRIPAIYLRDWPDVFIHTNNDTPANIDSTKMKRSVFIACASGYFLARVGPSEAARLAEEVFGRALGRVPREKEKARAVEAAGTQEAAEEARSIIAHSVETEAEAISSVLEFAPGDKNLQTTVEGLVDQLSGAWLLMTGKLTEQRKGNRIVFTLEQKEPSKESKPRNPKDASRPRSIGRRLQTCADPKSLWPDERVLLRLCCRTRERRRAAASE